MAFTHPTSSADNPDLNAPLHLEPVLLVPRKLTHSAYQTLLSCNYVPRRWHHGGRYGSRTHVVPPASTVTEEEEDGDRNKEGREDKSKARMGLPLIAPAGIAISSFLRRHNNEKKNSSATYPSENELLNVTDPELSNNEMPLKLQSLLLLEDVDLEYRPPTTSRNIPKVEPHDATVHPERLPFKIFDGGGRDFQSSSIGKSGGSSHSKKRGSSDCGSNISSSSSSNTETTRKKKRAAFTFIELFAGIGGFGVGLEALGGRCVLASEILKECIDVYQQNLSSHKNGCRMVGDIWEVDMKDIPQDFDLLVGGFPCQSFSSLGLQPGLSDTHTGKRNKNENDTVHQGDSIALDTDPPAIGMDTSNLTDPTLNTPIPKTRGMLYTQIVRILKVRKPKAFLLENVPGLKNTDQGQALSTITRDLEEAGYNVTVEVINARCLVAQSRKRLFFVGLLKSDSHGDDGFEYPYIPDLGIRASDILQSETELMTHTLTNNNNNNNNNKDENDLTTFYRLTPAQFAHLLRRSKKWRPGSSLAWPDKVCDTLDSHYGVTVSKGNSQLVPCQPPHPPRRFTPTECARFMGFGDGFSLGEFDPHSLHPVEDDADLDANKDGYDGHQRARTFLKTQYRMLGNAVCPPVVAAIAGAILARIPLQHPNEDDNRTNVDWVEVGRTAAIQLAIAAVAPQRRDALRRRLIDQGVL